jgi:hypothetical protein
MKSIKVRGVNILSLKLIGSLVIIGVVLTALVFSSFRSSRNSMSSMNMAGADTHTQVMADPAMKQTFVKLAAAHTDVCQNMGNKPAIDKYMSMLPSGSSLQGSCCSSMDMKKYVSQVSGLKQYSNIPQVPSDPYDMSVVNAKQMLGYYDNIQLTSAQQSVYDSAQSMTADKGWCCCQCWAWYTHAGLAKYLITQHNYTAQQVVAITNLEDCCGGA